MTKLVEAVTSYSAYLAHQRGWRHSQKSCKCAHPAIEACRKCGMYCAYCGGIVARTEHGGGGPRAARRPGPVGEG